MTEDSAPASPSLLRRLAALLYDILLVLPLIMTCVALAMGVRRLLGLGPADDGTVQLAPLLVQTLADLKRDGFGVAKDLPVPVAPAASTALR